MLTMLYLLLFGYPSDEVALPITFMFVAYVVYYIFKNKMWEE